MAETIRDVLINVSLKSDASGFKPPDLSQFNKQIDRVKSAVKAFDDLAASAKRAAEAVKTVGSTVDKETAASRKQLDATTKSVDKLTNSVKRAGQTIETQSKKSQAELKKLGRAAEEAQKSVGKIGQGAQQTGTETAESFIETLEALSKVGQGALNVAGAFAKLSAGSDAELEQINRQLGAVQEGLNLFNAGVGILKGTVQVIQGMRTAASSAATAETILAAANAGVATTGQTAAVSMAALNVSLGGIALVLNGIALAITAVAALWSFWKDADDGPKKVTEELERQQQALDANRAATKRLADARDEVGQHAIDMRKELAEFEGEATDSLEDKFRRIDARTQANTKDIVGADKNTRLTLAGGGEIDMSRRIDERFIEEYVSAQLGELDTLDKRRTQAQQPGKPQVLTNFNASQNIINADDEKTSRKMVQAALEMKAAEREKLTTIREQRQEVAKQLELRKAELKTARDAVREAQNRNDSLNETVGKLDPLQQRELKRLAQLAKEKGLEGLSNQQINRVEELTGGKLTESLRAERIRRGEATGLVENHLDVFNMNPETKQTEPLVGPGSQLERAKENYQAKKSELDEAIGSLETELHELKQQEASQVNRLVEAIRREFLTKSTLTLILKNLETSTEAQKVIDAMQKNTP